MNCCFRPSARNVTISTLDVEFKMPHNCNGCERAMTDAISNFKGVESCDTDTENQTIAVSGRFNLEKLVKKLKKVTSKEVEIVKKGEKGGESEIVEMVQEEEKKVEKAVGNDEKSEEDAKPEEVIEPNSDEYKDIEKILMFNEENPNSKCTIS